MAIDEFQNDQQHDAGMDGLDGGSGGFEGFDGSDGSGASKSRAGSALVMILLLAGSAGGLYSMRALGTSNASVGADQALETTIEDGLSKIRNVDDSALDRAPDLMPDYTDRQVDPESMTLNPFRSMAEPEPVVITDVSTEDDGPTPDEIRDAIDTAGRNTFVVTSILAGRENVALVNGEIVRAGDRLEAMTPYGLVEFEVAEIVREAVRLRAEHPELDAPVIVTFTVLAGGG